MRDSWPASSIGCECSRLGHPESVRVNQVVVFGKRKKTNQRGDPAGAEVLVRAGFRPDSIPVLNETVSERYEIPPSPPVTINCAGLPLDKVADA